MFKNLKRDIEAVLERDPAARSKFEVLFAYPGIHAIIWHRMAHAAWRSGFLFGGRMLSHLGRMLTGIEIHPGAKVGHGVFIDHGMGVVIGETAEIGDDVTLYQGVTLGGTSLEKGKRHPTLESGVIVGAGAKILGPITIGARARIGSNSVVLKDVAAEASVVGVPAKDVRGSAKPQTSDFDAYGTCPGDIPDPVMQVLNGLLDRVQTLSSRLEAVELERGGLKEIERENLESSAEDATSGAEDSADPGQA